MNRYIQLFRLGNCVMGVIGLILGAFVATGTSIVDYPVPIALASGVVFLFIIGGNSLNDYMDREVDKQAHPERPIPSGRMLPRTALYISIGAFVLSFVLSLFLIDHPLSILIVASAIIIMLAYELRLKREGFAGNLSIAWLTGALFLLGGAIVGKAETTIAFGAMAFLATLGREIVKDIQDMGSDFDRHTLPQSIGAKRAGFIGSAAFILAVSLSFEPILFGVFSGLPALGYLLVVLVADGIFIYCSIVHFRNPRQGQTWAKMGMIVALVAFLIGGLS